MKIRRPFPPDASAIDLGKRFRRRHARRPRAISWALIAAAVLLLGSVPAWGASGPKVLILGFDGMDPKLLAEFRAEGIMPNFERFLREGGELHRFGTSMPPQSPVAWANFITGQDPGGHGIFDFIHRDPVTLSPYLSTSDAKGPQRYIEIGSWKIPRDSGHVENLRHGAAFWELLGEAGVDATVFKVPSNFPPVECEARSLAGMGTPDIQGTYGIFTYITDDPPAERDIGGGEIVSVFLDRGAFRAELTGPANIYRHGDPASKVRVAGQVDPENDAVWLEIGDTELLLQEGEWSGWLRVEFSLVPLLKSVSGICRVYLKEAHPSLRLYVTPIQIDPVHPEMPLSTPEDYSAELAEAVGLYYTQGLPDDTKALEAGVFDDADYVGQSQEVFDERVRQFHHELERFVALESGFLFFYFNSPDQICHMTWRNMDPDSPTHAAADPHYAHRVGDIYAALDAILGIALDRVADDTVVMVMSDHGFAPYHRNFHVNAWLLENGYLHLRPGVERADVKFLQGIDWSRTRAYAIGINGLYLNQKGRESRGIVDPGREREELLRELVVQLEAAVDPVDRHRAIKHAYRTDEIYHGPYRGDGPDIQLGYYSGWRGSNESALGELPETVFSDNMLKWSGDHCMAADEVPGILLCNRPVRKPDPNLKDIAPTVLRLFGLDPPPEMRGSDLFAGEATEARAAGEASGAGGATAGAP